MSTMRYEQIGPADQPSPSIWRGFSLSRMREHSLGNYFHEDFYGVSANLTSATETTPQFGPLALDAEVATVIAALDDFGGKVDIETDGDDNDCWALTARPFAKTVLNSRQPWAFEGYIELGDVAMDGGMFFGLAEAAALSREAVADDAGGLIGESLVGFQVLADDPNAVDAVYKLDAGTAVEIIADATNSSVITAEGGTAASLANDTPVKLGMRFDGRETLEVYINGYKVASASLSATFPVGVEMGLVWNLKTGAAAAESAASDWIRAAYQERH